MVVRAPRTPRKTVNTRPLAPLKICVVTQEFFVTNQKSESAAAVMGLAQQLAAVGDSVTLVWLPPPGTDRRLHLEEFEKIEQYCFEQYLIRVEVLQDSPDLHGGIHNNQMASLAVYNHIKCQDYDVVYFALEGGLGYYTLLAVELGLYSPRPRIYVLANLPLIWQVEANRRFHESRREISTSYMERYCISMPDRLISSTHYMVEWMKSRSWTLPKDVVVMSPIRPNELLRPNGPEAGPPATRRVDELFVFSEPVYKNGLTLLCDALDRLSKQAPHPLTITVAGPFGRLLGEHTGSMLLRRARRWPFKIAMHPKMNESECLAYLKAKSCIAIMPNYAANASLSVMSCLEEGIPFIATDVGGTKELLSKSDRGIALCAANPDALANKIKSIIGKKAKAARPMMARSDALKLWADQREAVGREVLAAKVPRQPAKDIPPPLVSVVMVHYDRPEYVLDAIAAVEQQDYPNFELILVDDGSKNKESLALLSKLAVRFRKQGWTLIRTKNRYLGAARNTGVLKARGEFILFVDDDNALFPNAISTFVRAMTSSGADVCTTLARYFHQGNIPSDQANGMIHYVPLGGSLDLDLISNTYGDANAMIRRSAFDRIGFQNEQYGYTAQDWEFFTRAALAGLKVRVIPEALYWYRSSVEGMFRSSNWYENRLPILAAFRKHNFAGLEYLYDLAISQNVDSGEKESLHYNLRYNVGDEKLSRLGKFDPNSSEALELLAEVAATEGRPDLAIMLLGHNQRPEFAKRTFQSLLPRSSTEQAAIELSADLAAETTLETELLREMLVRSSAPGNTPHLAYVEGPDRIYLEARDVAVTMAVLTGGCPIGTASVTASVKLDQELATPCEFILLVLPLDADPVAAASEASNESGGWLSLTRPFETSPLSVVLSAPSSQTMNLVLGVRCKHRRPGERALGCFSKINIRRSLGYDDATRPRQGPPPLKQRARIISPDVLRKAELLAKFESSFPLVQFPKDEEGLFLRPSRSGAVAVNLPWAFPSFARGVVASVEVAHEDASPFEFSMLIKKPYAVVDWAGDIPTNFVAFSGWHRVERKFEIHKIEVKVDELSLEYMSLNVAVRLPPGSNPIPAQSFWRKLVLIWDS